MHEAADACRRARRVEARAGRDVRDVLLEARRTGDGRREVRGRARDGLGDPPRLRDVAAALVAALATIASPALIQAAVDAIPPALGPVVGTACAAVSVWALASGLGADR